MEFDYYNILKENKNWTNNITTIKYIIKDTDHVCPTCGSAELKLDTGNPLFQVKHIIFYKCECGWSGEHLITKGEYINIIRTNLIDEILD